MTSYEIVIRLPGRPDTSGRLSPGIYRVGSSPAAHIQLSLPDVSARHALLTVEPERVTVEDAGSTNGTFLNGRRIGPSAVPWEPGAELKLGSAMLVLRARAGEKPGGGDAAAHLAGPVVPPARAAAANPEHQAGMLLLSGIRYEYRKVVQELKRRVHAELIRRLNLQNLTLSGADQQEIARQARETIQVLLAEYRRDIPRGVESAVLEKELVDEAVGLGPVEMLLANDDVTEVMCNGHANIYVEKAGMLYRTDLAFADDNQLLNVIERIVAPLGRRVDESQPLVDARLPDGSRVNAIIPPLAIDGPTLTIRKFSREPMTAEMLVGNGTFTRGIGEFLRLCVLVRRNILISGGTGSGKTTLLNVASNYLPNNERIVTIEDAAELRLAKDHVVRLEARPPNIEGRGAIAIRDLVRNALRMRPDRIVIGECRGGEALDMLQAMNTGHDGSLTTIHANSPRDALARLETLVLMAGFDLPLRAIREQISSAISLIVQIARQRDGSRKVVQVTEVTGMEGEVITTQDLFEYRQEGLGADGRLRGGHLPCGIVPTFLDEFRYAGLEFDISIFSPG